MRGLLGNWFWACEPSYHDSALSYHDNQPECRCSDEILIGDIYSVEMDLSIWQGGVNQVCRLFVACSKRKLKIKKSWNEI